MNPLQFVPKAAPQQRQYAGADFGRLFSDWVAGSTSQDAESRMALRTMRNRVRQLGRDNDYVVNALRAIQNNVVGQGVGMQAQVMRLRGPGAGKMDDATNSAIETAWTAWKRADSCHTAGVLSFEQIERVLVRSVAESGEIFVRLIRKPFGRSPVPLGLEIIEADLLDESYNGESLQGNQIRMGVEVNEWHRPVAYHFFTQHPGDIQFGGTAGVAQKRIRVPANEVIHLFRTERPGQTRGIPWFASALTRLRHMNGYEEAEVIAARASACQMGFIKTPNLDFEPQDPAYQDATMMDGQRVESFEPGKIRTLGPGEEFQAFAPTRPSGLLDPFMRYMLRATAAGVGVSYETLSKDYSQSNYSSSRLALLDDRDTWRQLQSWLIAAFHQRVFEAWLQLAVLSGTLNLAGYEIQRDRFEAVKWMARGWSWVDPAKEISAARMAVRAGFTTLTDVIAQQGGDYEDLVRTRRRELDFAEEQEVYFDTDPEEFTDKGQAQVEAPEPGETGQTGAEPAETEA